MSFPPAPIKSLDWSTLGFKVRNCNGHIESRYTTAGGWSVPRFVKDPYLRIHGMAPGLNYGQQCYEGLKAFRLPGDDIIAIFRPDQNAKRMQHSAEVVSIPPVPVEHFERCVQLAVGLNAEFVPPHNTGAAMYIRPVLLGTQDQLPLQAGDEYMFVVYVMPTQVYHGVNPIDGLILEEFDRAAPRGTGSAKVGGNYAPVLRWSDYAKKEGFGITLHMDSVTRTTVDEFSTSAFIGVKKTGNGENDYTVVVPASETAIKSVTSDSACEIARSLGLKVERREVHYDELKEFAEVIAGGTAAALVPLKSLTMKSKGDKFEYAGQDGKPGPVHGMLTRTLEGIQRGTVKDDFGWLRIVKEPREYESDSAITSNGGAAGNVDSLP